MSFLCRKVDNTEIESYDSISLSNILASLKQFSLLVRRLIKESKKEKDVRNKKSEVDILRRQLCEKELQMETLESDLEAKFEGREEQLIEVSKVKVHVQLGLESKRLEQHWWCLRT